MWWKGVRVGKQLDQTKLYTLFKDVLTWIKCCLLFEEKKKKTKKQFGCEISKTKIAYCIHACENWWANNSKNDLKFKSEKKSSRQCSAHSLTPPAAFHWPS